MRPYKHVATTTNDEGSARYQNILGIDLGRFSAPWGDVPIVATAETDLITIYYWSDAKRQWESFLRPHDALTTGGTNVDAPLTWNWSDRVAIACSSTTVYVIYKRARFPNSAALIIDRLVLDGQELRLRDSLTVPLAVGTEVGRSLWAGYDDKNGQLLVLTQLKSHPSVIGPPHSFPFPAGPPPSWELDLLKIQFDQNDNITASSSKIDDGGYDLDARLDGDRLLAVYRKKAEALRIRTVDLLEHNRFTNGIDADQFYERLQLTVVNVATLQETTEAIPGGEHPQIQNVHPLLITMDRPDQINLSAKVDVDTSTFPPTINVSQFVWNQGRMTKIALLRETEGTFRGTLLTSDDQAIPRSHSAISRATHLLELRDGFLLHAAPFPYFPVSLLAIDHVRKDLVLDLLHHRDFIGLFRTRLRATLSNNVLTVSDRSFEVWDIGHAQIKDPLSLIPAADGENDQFAPFDRVPVTASISVTTGPLCADNTMGGHLVADLSRQPVGFFAYTDLGDGCLRVIFASDMPTLRDPPPMQGEKILRPEQVTGPHLPCEEWIELQATDLINSELVSYSVGIGHANDQDKSLGSSFEVAVDTLLNGCAQVSDDAAVCGGAAVVPLDGVTRDQLVDVDELLSKLVPITISVNLSDGRTGTVSLKVRYPMACGSSGEDVPAGLFIADMPVNLELTIDADGSKPGVIWTITPLANALGIPLPPGPIVPGGPDATFSPLQRIAVGNGASVATGISGTQRLSVFVTDDVVHSHTPSAATNIEVQESSYRMLTSLTDSLAEIEYIRVGALSLLGLQYEVDFSADDPAVVTIATQAQRATQFRFRGNGFRQGLIESDLVLTFSSQDIKLRYGLDLDGFVTVDDFKLSLHYGRLFTPGVLMRDVRSRDILQGTDLGANGFDLVKRNDPRRHAAIAAKPFTGTNIPKYSTDIGISITPWGISIPALLAALAIVGAFGIAETIVALYGAFLAAVALGVAGIAIAVTLSIALAIYIATTVPRTIEDFIAGIIDEKFADRTIIDTLNQPPTDALIRYSGEGAAEAIARKVLAASQSFNFNAPQPADPGDQEDVGIDRFRGQIFQMIFVSEGVCRVLVRFDDCLEAQRPRPRVHHG